MYQQCIKVVGIVLLFLAAPAAVGADVRLTVQEPSGVQRVMWPVTSGIPMRQGALKDPAATALFDANGKQLPLQTEVLARWSDGSIRWLLVDSQIDLNANETKTLLLRHGSSVQRAAVENPVQVVQEPAGPVVIMPGPVRLEYGSQDDKPAHFFPQGLATLTDGTAGLGHRLTFNCSADGIILRGGQGANYKPQIDQVVVEQAGPVRACIRFSGSHVGQDGSTMMRYIARVHAWRNQPYVRVYYTLVNDWQESTMHSFDQLGVSFWVRSGGRARCLLNGQPDLQGPLFQVDENQYLCDGQPAGRRACGWAAAGGDEGGLAVGLREFWQNWPKSIDAGAHRVRLDLFPQLPAGLYDGKPLLEESKLYYYLRDQQHTLKIGAAKTHEMWIKYLSGPPDGEALNQFFQAAEDPLLATCEPAHVSATQAAGRFPPADPQKFGGYDRILSDALDGHLQRRDQVREYGLLNYGDWYGERSVNWGNLEYDLAHGLFLQYLRTGDRRYFLRAEQAARHHIDVDVVHATNPHVKNPWGTPPRVGDVWLHCVGHTGGYYENAPLPVDKTYQMGHSTNFGHVWVSGDLDYYHLTGDRRAREVAIEIADAMAAHMPTQYGTHIRALGWPMILVLDAYEATSEEKYLQAARANWDVLKENIDWEKGWVVRLASGHCLHEDRSCYGNVPFMEGLTLCALARYHRITQDPEVLRAISVGIDQMIRECWQEDAGTFSYTACPLSSRTPYVLFALSAEAMAYEAELTGNQEHRRILRKGLLATIGKEAEFGKSLAQLIFFTPHGLAALEP
jgi:hypothetical protein